MHQLIRRSCFDGSFNKNIQIEEFLWCEGFEWWLVASQVARSVYGSCEGFEWWLVASQVARSVYGSKYSRTDQVKLWTIASKNWKGYGLLKRNSKTKIDGYNYLKWISADFVVQILIYLRCNLVHFNVITTENHQSRMV